MEDKNKRLKKMMTLLNLMSMIEVIDGQGMSKQDSIERMNDLKIISQSSPTPPLTPPLKGAPKGVPKGTPLKGMSPPIEVDVPYLVPLFKVEGYKDDVLLMDKIRKEITVRGEQNKHDAVDQNRAEITRICDKLLCDPDKTKISENCIKGVNEWLDYINLHTKTRFSKFTI